MTSLFRCTGDGAASPHGPRPTMPLWRFNAGAPDRYAAFLKMFRFGWHFREATRRSLTTDFRSRRQPRSES